MFLLFYSPQDAMYMPTFFDSMSCPLSFSTISSHYLEIVHTINQLPIGPSNVHPMVTQIKDGIINLNNFLSQP